MNYRDYIVYDFETTSANPATTQAVQIAAVAVNGRKLEIKEGSEFQSLIRPEFDPKECLARGIDPLTQESISIHGKTEEVLRDAPSPRSVWQNFAAYVNGHNYRKNDWNTPISVGYNIDKFDSVIAARLCREFGPEKDGRPSIFNRFYSVDLLPIMFCLFENNTEVNSLSADNLIRGHMGYAKGTAHDAMSDVIMTAEVFCRTQHHLRKFASGITFKNSLKGFK